MSGYQYAAECLLTLDPRDHDLRPALAAARWQNGLADGQPHEAESCLGM